MCPVLDCGLLCRSLAGWGTVGISVSHTPMGNNAVGRTKALVAQAAGETVVLGPVSSSLVLLKQAWCFIQSLALAALEACCVGGTVQSHMRGMGILSNKVPRTVWAHQRSSGPVLTAHVQRQLEPKCEGAVTLGAGEGVAACVGGLMLAELQGAVGGKGAVRAAHMPHTRHGFQFLGRQLLLVHNGHVGLLLALIRELVATQPASKLEIASVDQTFVVTHVVQGSKLFGAVWALGSIGKIMSALVLGQTAPAGVAVAALIAQEWFRLCVAPEMPPIATERLQPPVTDLADVIAI